MGPSWLLKNERVDLPEEKIMMPKGGPEPPRVAPHAPQTCASASSATSALRRESISLSPSTDNSADALAQPRVERIANPLAEEVVRQHRDEDREARINRQPPADLNRILAFA